MTPQERQLVAELFDRLAKLETAPRDREAESAIAEGLQAAPNAVYPLVQTVLVQDEALKRANDCITELEAELGIEPEQPDSGGFLDGMRDKLFGSRDEPRGSVPTVRPGDLPMGAPDLRGSQSHDPRWNNPNSRWNSRDDSMAPQQPASGGGGGSFLGTAASVAAGAVGGALLLHGIRSMFGQSGSAHAAFDPGLSGGGASPWGGSGGGDLAQQAGLGDIGKSPTAAGPGSEPAGLFGSGDGGVDYADYDDSDYDDDGDALGGDD